MKLKTRIKRLRKRLGKKALREPKTKSQIRDRINYDRVSMIWNKRYKEVE
jgi:hypothetical protein